MPPDILKLQGSWSKVGHAAREMAMVYSLTFVVISKSSWSNCQDAPLQWKVSLHISAKSSWQVLKLQYKNNGEIC